MARLTDVVAPPPFSQTASFTPGPWQVAYLDRNSQRVVKNQDIEICTCWHHSVGSIEKEMEANARLIAAAPELLAALEAIANLDGSYFDRAIEARVLARAAIAKAKAGA